MIPTDAIPWLHRGQRVIYHRSSDAQDFYGTIHNIRYAGYIDVKFDSYPHINENVKVDNNMELFLVCENCGRHADEHLPAPTRKCLFAPTKYRDCCVKW